MKWFIVPLNPEPWAIGPVGFSRKSGSMSAYVGRNQQLDAYKQAVAEEISSQYEGGLLEGPIELFLFFWRQRSEYTTPNQRLHRKHEADVTNMQKATEDALQGILFENDRDIVHVDSHLVAQGPDVEPKIVIGIREFRSAWPDLLKEIPNEVWSRMHPAVQPVLEADDRLTAEEIF